MNGGLYPQIECLSCCKLLLDNTLANLKLHTKYTYRGSKIKHINTLTKYSQDRLGNRMPTLESYGMMMHAKKHSRNHVCETTIRLVIIKIVFTTITKERKLKTYQHHILTSLSKGTHRSAPQIKLWGGVNLKRIRENHSPRHNSIERIKLLCPPLPHHSNTHYHTWLGNHMSNKMLYGMNYKNLRKIRTQTLKTQTLGICKHNVFFTSSHLAYNL